MSEFKGVPLHKRVFAAFFVIVGAVFVLAAVPFAALGLFIITRWADVIDSSRREEKLDGRN